MRSKPIAILGAESTGKSTLALALSKALGAPLVPEVLRGWCETLGRTPTQMEQRGIFDAQCAAERQACAVGTKWVVCDTTPLTIALASIHYFHDSSLLAEALAHQRGYAVTLLCMPDIAWVADGFQRDGPAARADIHALTLDVLGRNAIAFTKVTGDGGAREARAIAAVQWLTEA